MWAQCLESWACTSAAGGAMGWLVSKIADAAATVGWTYLTTQDHGVACLYSCFIY